MTLQLGATETKDDVRWLYIHRSPTGEYVTWPEEEDADYREMFGLAADAPVARIKVRRQGAPEVKQEQRDRMRKVRNIGARPPQPLIEKITREVHAHAVLLDWDGITMPDGSAATYTPEVGTEAFRSDEDFHDAVVAASADAENFRQVALQEDAEALGNGSSGSSSGAPKSNGSSTQGSTSKKQSSGGSNQKSPKGSTS